MVMTHKSVKEQKSQKIYIKEPDARRKFMTKDEAIAANKALREDREKVEAYAAGLKKERETKVGAPTLPEDTAYVSPEVAERWKKIEGLEKTFESTKGPGSKAKKEKIREEINRLKHSYWIVTGKRLF